MAIQQQGPGKDLGDFRKLPRSAVASYMYKAATEQQKRFHFLLGAFLPQVFWQWLTQYLRNRWGSRHKFLSYVHKSQENGIYHLRDDSLIGGPKDLDGEIRVSLAGDWGTGTDEANEVANQMMRFRPHYTIHLGDVYYVGDVKEVEENCLGIKDPKQRFTPCRWPLGSVGSFALNGNHEMYALGEAYFDRFLPTLGIRPRPGANPAGQKASFFCLENEYWRIIALDTGYNSIGFPILELIIRPSCKLRKEELQWLRDVVKPNQDKRGIILLTHHQHFSSFDQEYPKTAAQLAPLIDRRVLWFWGHEHRMSVYGRQKRDGAVEANARCVGHGGMPVELNPKLKHPQNPLVMYDNRTYPSPENITVGYNGFVNLKFKANQLSIDYRDLKNNLLLTEEWGVDCGGLVGKAVINVNQHPDFVKAAAPILAIM
jgi:hypothetical protein